MNPLLEYFNQEFFPCTIILTLPLRPRVFSPLLSSHQSPTFPSTPSFLFEVDCNVYATDLEISICYLKLFACSFISLFVLQNVLPPSKDIISVSGIPLCTHLSKVLEAGP